MQMGVIKIALLLLCKDRFKNIDVSASYQFPFFRFPETVPRVVVMEPGQIVTLLNFMKGFRGMRWYNRDITLFMYLANNWKQYHSVIRSLKQT